MKTGMTLNDLAVEVDRQAKVKEDFIAPTNLIHVEYEYLGKDDGRYLVDMDAEVFGIRDHAHNQIAQYTEIPLQYYRRMMSDAPELLTDSVNHWFYQKPENRLVRTLDGNMRAFLSNKYRVMDNYDLMEAILPALQAAGASIHSADVSDNKMYLKAVMDNRTKTISAPPGRQTAPVVINPGIIISNSEIGDGSITVQPAIHTLACLNMAVWAQGALRRRHLGSRLSDDNNNIVEYFSDATRELNDAALWSQVRDIVEAAMSGTMFDDIVRQLEAARQQTFQPSQLNTVIERVGNRFAIPERDHGGIMGHLIEGGDFSKFGLHNAITRHSQDLDSYSRATEFEVLGGEIVSLVQRDWDALIREVAVA